MTSEQSSREQVSAYLLDLYGGDPYAHVYRASNEHREAHGPECGVYPSGPVKMRLLSVLVRASGARRVLEVGCGLGYSALWLADAVGDAGSVETIERDPQHARLAQQYVAAAGFAQRVRILEGDADDILSGLSGPYDLVHDDGWFMQEPAYLETMVGLIRPGGLLAMSNWFPLEDAVTGKPQMDWPSFGFGPDWPNRIRAYARKLASHPSLRLAFATQPWLGLAAKVE